MPTLITDVKATLNALEGTKLLVVKVENRQPGPVGLGCGTFTNRTQSMKVMLSFE